MSPMPHLGTDEELRDQAALRLYLEKVEREHQKLLGKLGQQFDTSLRLSYVPVQVSEERAPWRARELQRGYNNVLLPPTGPTASFEEQLREQVRRGVLRATLGGPPGSGKTMTQRVFAYEQARRWLSVHVPARRRRLVPIYVHLPAWLGDPQHASRDLLGYLAERERSIPGLEGALRRRALRTKNESNGGTPGRELADGDLVLLLDGFDELDESGRRLFEQQQELLTTTQDSPWARVPIVIGTRRYLSAALFDEPGWAHLDMCWLSPAQALGILYRLLRSSRRLREEFKLARPTASHREFRRQRVAPILARWRARWTAPEAPRCWREALQSPLYVSLIAYLETQGVALEAEKTRLEFFECFARHAWHGDLHRGKPFAERRARATPPETPPELKLLQRIAYDMTVERQVRWSAERVRRAVNEAELDSLAQRCMLFAPETDDEQAHWRFWHRSFQEALYAWELWESCVEPHGKNPARAAQELVQRLEAPPSSPALQAQMEREQRERVAQLKEKLHADWRENRPGMGQFQLRMEFRWVQREGGSAWTRFLELNQEEYRARIRGDRAGWGVARNQVGDLITAELAKHRAEQEELSFRLEPLALIADHAQDLPAVLESLAASIPAHLLSLLLSSFERMDSFEHLRFPVLLESLLRKAPSSFARRDVLERLATLAPIPQRDQTAERLVELALQLSCELDEHAAWIEAVRALESRDTWPHDLPLAGETTLLRRFCRQPAAEELATLDRELSAEFFTGRGEMRPRWRELDAGSYPVGTPMDHHPRFEDERPYVARLSHPIWLGATSVLCTLYRIFDPAHETYWRHWRAASDTAIPERAPVVGVSHYAARAFCRWLALHSADLLRDLVGYRVVPRLPTEAEREIAARGGHITLPSLKHYSQSYSFGDDPQELSHHGWYAETSRASRDSNPELQLVAELEPNPLGLFDMHGGIREWCIDWYAPYPIGIALDPHGARSGRGRVLRGGSFRGVAVVCRSASRSASNPTVRVDYVGFRIALAPAPYRTSELD